jgi:diguanylate cyclase (GGDEF)-like protein
LFTIAIAFITLAMAKERTELRHKAAARVDPLTGIANRRAFLEEAMPLGPLRRVASRPISVLLADLDRFKVINDRFGHAVGDRVLQLFAEVASAQLGPHDLIGRLGGEEFSILLRDAGRERAAATAERIRRSFELVAAKINGYSVCATVSMGVAVADGGFELPALLAEADAALYCAKERGRNRVEIASAQPESSEQRAGGTARSLASASATAI